MSLPAAPVLFAGGGTVGHLAPAFALAEALEARGAAHALATPGEEQERAWLPEGAPAPHRVDAPRFPRRPAALLAFLPRLLRAVRTARALLRRLRPGVVVGLGGWPCVPTCLAAVLERVPLALITSDRRPGLVVRLLAPAAWRVYAAHAASARALTRRLLPGPLPATRVTGVLVRPAVVAARPDPAALGLREGLATLFVVGGSLGARALNEAVVAGLAAAVEADPALVGRLQVLHATGRQGEGVEQAYLRLGLPHRVVPFVRAIGTAYRSASLVLSRAGALTCAELEATGAPAVLVPYPHHPDRQQYGNAAPLVARGGALLIEEAALTPARVRDEVVPLALHPARLRALSLRLKAAFHDAAPEVAEELVERARGRREPRPARAAAGGAGPRLRIQGPAPATDPS